MSAPRPRIVPRRSARRERRRADRFRSIALARTG
jgi:extracellular elastinolytic metalloproteinase